MEIEYNNLIMVVFAIPFVVIAVNVIRRSVYFFSIWKQSVVVKARLISFERGLVRVADDTKLHTKVVVAYQYNDTFYDEVKSYSVGNIQFSKSREPGSECLVRISKQYPQAILQGTLAGNIYRLIFGVSVIVFCVIFCLVGLGIV